MAALPVQRAMGGGAGRESFDWSGWLVVLGPAVGGLLLSQMYRGRADAWMLGVFYSAVYAVLQVGLLAVDSRVLAKRGMSAGGYASCGVLALSLAFWPVLMAVYVVYLLKRDREGLPRKLPFGIASLLLLLGGFVYGNTVFDKAEARCELVVEGLDLVCEVHNPTPGVAHSCFQVVLVADAGASEIAAGAACASWLGWGDAERGSVLTGNFSAGAVLDQIRNQCFPQSRGFDVDETPACTVRTVRVLRR